MNRSFSTVVVLVSALSFLAVAACGSEDDETGVPDSGAGVEVDASGGSEPAVCQPATPTVPDGFGGDTTPSFALDVSITDGTAVEFIEHIDADNDESFDNWLGMNLPFAPAEALFQALEEHLGQALINRGEAHITVITPPEYVFTLRPYITIGEIHDIARSMNIQSAEFALVCLGRGQDTVADQLEQTYYVVVESEELREIRREIFRRYTANGGEPSKFDPDEFWPHITIGFPTTDIFTVRTGANSCWATLQ
ncbi:MAG: hypothetical protein AAGC55_33680 [Myxococcota bacterium]